MRHLPFEWALSLRYLKAKRQQVFISLITWISVGGVAVGVMALIVVLAVMSGFEDLLKHKIVGTNAHVVVLQLDSHRLQDYERRGGAGATGTACDRCHPVCLQPGDAELAHECDGGRDPRDRSRARAVSDRPRQEHSRGWA